GQAQPRPGQAVRQGEGGQPPGPRVYGKGPEARLRGRLDADARRRRQGPGRTVRPRPPAHERQGVRAVDVDHRPAAEGAGRGTVGQVTVVPTLTSSRTPPGSE